MEMYCTQSEKQQRVKRRMLAIMAAVHLTKVYRPGMSEEQCRAEIISITGDDETTITLAAFLWADTARRVAAERQA